MSKRNNKPLEFVVKKIDGHCLKQFGRDEELSFLVFWADGSKSWEPVRNLTNCMSLVYKYINKQKKIDKRPNIPADNNNPSSTPIKEVVIHKDNLNLTYSIKKNMKYKDFMSVEYANPEDQPLKTQQVKKNSYHINSIHIYNDQAKKIGVNYTKNDDGTTVNGSLDNMKVNMEAKLEFMQSFIKSQRSGGEFEMDLSLEDQ